VREVRRDAEERERENQFVGPDLLRYRHRLKERIEGANEETIEASFADHRRNFPDGEEERVVKRVAEHPEPVQECHFAEIPAVHGGKLVQRYPERADGRRVIDQREAEPQKEVGSVLQDRQKIDAPVLNVRSEAHAG
jgi:hypothetical protein